MKRNRPNSVLVVGVLNIVFGALGFVFTCCGGMGMAAVGYLKLPGPGTDDIYKPFRDVIAAKLPNLYVLAFSLLAAGLILWTILVVSGIGLIRMKSWGRVLTLAFAILFTFVQGGSIIWNYTVANPVMEEGLAAMYKNMPGQNPAGVVGSKFGEIFGFVVYALEQTYSVVMLIIMFLPSVRAAFARANVSDPEMEP